MARLSPCHLFICAEAVEDGVLQWSAAEQMPLGYDVPLTRPRRPRQNPIPIRNIAGELYGKLP